MRHFTTLAAAAAALFTTAAAIAKDKPEAAGDKKICKFEDDSTSRIGRTKICKTREEWNAQSREERQDGSESQQSAGRGR